MTAVEYEQLDYDARYYIQGAKNAIESLTHIVEELASNEDEAITKRAHRDGGADTGVIAFAYDPDTNDLTVTGDGVGMTSAQISDRLGRVGFKPEGESKRSFFHRGARDVFMAMGGGYVASIGQAPSGEYVYSKAHFDPHRGIALLEADQPVTDEIREELGLPEGTGTSVTVSVRNFARAKPREYEFAQMETQIRDCVGLRVVLTDPNRAVSLKWGDEPPRPLTFTYPDGEDLVVRKDVTIDGQTGSLWAGIADEPLKGRLRNRTRTNGILIRSERAAYEASQGKAIQSHPAMVRVYGELRIDGIEELQRQADSDADDESQLIYKTDRSGLNSEHPFVEAIQGFIDDTLAPLIKDLDASQNHKPVTPDVRRQLQKLAREINQAINDMDTPPVGDSADPRGTKTDKERFRGDHPEPPDPAKPEPRIIEDGVGFAYDRIFMEVGAMRTVEVWFDSSKIPVGTPATVISTSDDVVSAAVLSRSDVAEPEWDGVSVIDLTIAAGDSEGRHEIVVDAGAFRAVLPVHTRFPRASGWISNIVSVDDDRELGSALRYPLTGVVEVYVGRPEFRDAAVVAERAGILPWKHPEYRRLVVESVREAALWPAAQQHAEEALDELSAEERRDPKVIFNSVQFAFQELDYKLRARLHKVFAEAL